MRGPILAIGLVALTSCSALGPVGALLGGGPKVAANVQAAKTATQTVGQTVTTDASHAGKVDQSRNNGVSAGTVGRVTITPWWTITPAGLILALMTFLYGWLHWRRPGDRPKGA